MNSISSEERERVAKDNYEAARAIKLDTTAHMEKAHVLLSSALIAKPTFVNALILRSSIRAKLEDTIGAIADLTIAIELEALEVDKRRLASLYAARALLFAKLGKEQEQLNDFSAALESEPDNGTWCYEIGQMYWRRGNFTLASQYWQEALDDKLRGRMTNTTRLRVLLSYGVCKLRIGAIDQAQVLFSKAQNEHETPQVLFCLGLAEYKRANYKIAADHLHKAVEGEQCNVKYGVCLVVCLFQLCDYQEALRVASSILSHYNITTCDKHTSIFYTIGLLTCLRVACELMIGLHEQALTVINRLLDTITNASDNNVKEKNESFEQEPEQITSNKSKSDSDVATLENWTHVKGYDRLYSTALYLKGLVLCAKLTHFKTRQEAVEVTTDIDAELAKETLASSDELTAQNTFQSALTVNSEFVECYMHLGLFAHRAHDLYSALNYFHMALSLISREHHILTVPLLECIGLVYCDLTFYDNAIRFFSACKRLCPTSMRFTYRIAVTEIRAQNPFGALAYTEQLVNDIITCYKSEEKKEEEEQQQLQQQQEQQQQLSQKLQQQEVEQSEEESELRENNCIDFTSPSFIRVESILKSEHDLVISTIFYLHALTLYMLNRYNDALCWVHRAIDLHTKTNKSERALLFLLRAKIAFKLEEYTPCIDDCNIVLECAPECVEALYLRGQAFHSCRSFAEALADFESAVQINCHLEKCDCYHYARGVIVANMNNMSKACSCFDCAIDLCENAMKSANNTNVAPVIYYHERAKARQLIGLYKEALSDYNVVLSQQANNFHALVNRSLVYKQLHDFSASARDWQRGVALDAQNVLRQFDASDLHELHYIRFTAPGEEQ